MESRKNIAIAIRLDEPYPHHQRLFEGIQRYAKQRGDWNCLIDEYPGYRARDRGSNYPKYDGVIARADQVMQRRIKRMRIPFVNTQYQHKNPDVPGVYTDSHGLGKLAAEHLITRGFRRLFILLDHNHAQSNAIREAFLNFAQEEEIQECGIVEVSEESFERPEYWMNLEKCIADLIGRLEPPVGIFVETAQVARLLVQQSIVRGLRVPQDIAVLCQQNLPAVVDVSPKISRIDINHELVGYENAAMLDRLIAGEKIQREHVFIPPVGIIGCESTDYFAVQDPVVSEALQFISSRLTQKLRIEDIAYALAISSSQLKNRFDAALGCGVGQEIRRLRLEVAKRMLADPDQPIDHVAKASGFTNADVLNQVFRRELGMTPTKYRKKILGEISERRRH